MAFEKYFLIGFSSLGLGFAFLGLYENFKKRSEMRKAVRQLQTQDFPSVADILDNIDKVIAHSVAVRKRRDGKKSATIVLGGRLIAQYELQSDIFQGVKLITKVCLRHSGTQDLPAEHPRRAVQRLRQDSEERDHCSRVHQRVQPQERNC